MKLGVSRTPLGADALPRACDDPRDAGRDAGITFILQPGGFMKPLLATVLVLITLVLVPQTLAQGLYGNEGKDVTSGDLNDQDYWWTKYDMMMLDKAIEQRQPEYQIGLNLVSTRHRLDDLVKKYPKHEEIKKWKEHADDVAKRINPNADRMAQWKPGCPWQESNFAQAWVNYHWAKMEIADKQIDEAKGSLNNVSRNLDLLTEKEDRMKDYPDDLRKWVIDTKPEVQKMLEDLKKSS
jgi:hypothetical protein